MVRQFEVFFRWVSLWSRERHRDYSGRAAILKVIPAGWVILTPPRRHPLSAEPYRDALLVRPHAVVDRDDVGLHRSVLLAVLSRRPRQTPRRSFSSNRVARKGKGGSLPMLQQMTELGIPPWPKRDASRTISAWPLQRPALPWDSGCIPRSRVRAEISEQARTCTGRIRFHQFSLLIKSHRLRLSSQHLRFTRHPDRAGVLEIRRCVKST